MRKGLFFVLFTLSSLVLFAQNIWVNEFHYDNVSTDEGEFIEIVFEVQPGDVLSEFEITLYNGSSGVVYNEKTLDEFTAGAVVEGYSFFSCFIEGIQNGAPDGIAISKFGSVIQFISYEGVFEATEGVASGQTSIDIGVEETNATEAGLSLQLTGSGAQYNDFAWLEPSANTMGELNTGQSFGGTPDPLITVTSPNGGEEWEQGTTHTITWNSISFDGLVNIFLQEAWEGRDYLVTDLENTGSWSWEIPVDQTVHPNYSIIVSGIDEGDPSDISDAEFAIIEPIQAVEVTIYEIQFTEDESGDSPYIDQLVNTSGVITAIYENFFFIQDGAGCWNGVCVYPSEFELPELAIGYEIEVVANVAEYNNKTELADLVSIEILNETADLPLSETISTGAISMPDLYNPESWEGVLVDVQNVFVTNPDLGYGNWEIDDGLDNSGPCVVGCAGEYDYTPVLEDTFIRITGIVDYVYGSFKLEPRNNADLIMDPVTLEITPSTLEFITYEDCEDGKEFVINNVSDIEITIESIEINAEFSGAVAFVGTELDYPIMLAAGESQAVLIIVDFMTRDLEEGEVIINTSAGEYVVTLIYNDELNSSNDENEINAMNVKLSNYPNPFNPSRAGHSSSAAGRCPTTTISFNLNNEMVHNAQIEIYNIKGQKIISLNIDDLEAKTNAIIWDGTDGNGRKVSSGIYYYTLVVDNKTISSNKMVMMK